MEYQILLNLLNKGSDSKFLIRKWSIVDDQLHVNYDIGKEITYNTEKLKPNVCHYNDVYISLKGDITVTDFTLSNSVSLFLIY